MTDLPPSQALVLPAKDLSAFDGVLWRRTLAYFLDLFFAFLFFLPLAAFLFLGGFITFALLWAPLPFLWLGVNVVYYVALVGGGKSSTWGHRLLGLRVVPQEGQPPSYFQALLQIFVFYVSVGITYGLVLLVGLFNAKSRLIHDYFSGIVVQKRP